MAEVKDIIDLSEINCDVPVIIKTGKEKSRGRCFRISLKKIAVQTDKGFEPNSVVSLTINTGDFNYDASAEAVVEKVVPAEDGEFCVFLKITGTSRENEKKLSFLYISTLWQEVTSRIPDRNSSISPRNLVGLFDREELVKTLGKMVSAEHTMYLIHPDTSQTLTIKFKKLTEEKLLFEVEEGYGGDNETSISPPVYVYWAHGFRQHLFVSAVKEFSLTTLTLELPILLLSSSLREEERNVVEPGTMWVEIPLPYPRGAKIKREIIDISSGGFAFKCPIDSAYFLPGTPISSLKIYGRDREPFVSAGQIRHVTPVTGGTGEPYLKVGVQLQISNKAFAKGHSQPQLAKRTRKIKKEKLPPRQKTGGIFNTLKQVLKKGIRPVTAHPDYGSKTASDTRSFRILNRKNQEIVGLLNTTWKGTERRRATVILLPPPYGKRKEALGLFAYYLIERFKNQFKDAVVIRYDSTNHVGDSYKDPPCREPWKECLHMTLSQGTEDLLSVLDFIENNDHFLTKEIVLVSFSIGALLARKAIVKDSRHRVHFWIAPMGATHMGDLLIRVSGGIDYFDLYEKGQELGNVTILGITVEGNRFCEDALSRGYVTLYDAMEDMSRIKIPVIWLYGEYDSWIDPESVEKLLEAKSSGFKKIRLIPTGHLPLNGEEALEVFDIIFEEMWPLITKDEMVEFTPNLTDLIEKQEQEWKQNPKDLILSRKKYWSTYLMGEKESDLGYDILRYCEEYVEFIREQIRLLDIKQDQNVADMGCGTGNLVLQFLEDYDKEPRNFPVFTMVDLIEEALRKAKSKCESVAAKKGIDPGRLRTHRADLDIHPALPLKKFVLGEFYTVDDLKGQLPGVSSYTINLWKTNFGKRLYYLLRGKKISNRDIAYLDSLFPEEEKEIILQFNLASRIIKHMISSECPLLHHGCTTLTDKEKNTDSLLGIDFKNLAFRLPFENNTFDRLVSSLVLSYMKNPLDTLFEFARCLKPDGIMVVSSMKPHTDMSSIFTRMIDRINDGTIPIPSGSKEKYLKATRDFANSAAQLMQLVDERKFRFFHPEELSEMMEEAGMRVIEISESYGNPPQAYIIKAQKRKTN